jgi:hypothetical protein
VVLNRARGPECLERAGQIFQNTPVTVLGSLPEDAELGARDADGEPIWTLPTENPLLRASSEIMARLVTAPQGSEPGNKVTE